MMIDYYVTVLIGDHVQLRFRPRRELNLKRAGVRPPNLFSMLNDPYTLLELASWEMS